MLKIKTSLSLSAAVAAFSMMGTLCHAKDVTIAFAAAGLQAPFNVAVAKGFKEEAAKLGAKSIVLDGKFDTRAQATAIADLIAQKVNGITLIPIDSVVAQTYADDAAAAGIPFVPVGGQVGDPTKRELRDVYETVSALITG